MNAITNIKILKSFLLPLHCFKTELKKSCNYFSIDVSREELAECTGGKYDEWSASYLLYDSI